ncbi:hypothetical protein D9M68_691790 [compost metagenome]
MPALTVVLASTATRALFFSIWKMAPVSDRRLPSRSHFVPSSTERAVSGSRLRCAAVMLSAPSPLVEPGGVDEVPYDT